MSVIITEHATDVGRVASCPPWCIGGHDSDNPDDVFHRGPFLKLKAPDGTGPTKMPALPALCAQLVMPEVAEDDDPACIIIDHNDVYGPYAQLDVEAADQMIRDLKTYTACLQQLRDQLAATKEQRS
ncbi:hypothetical protein HZZ00_34960 [Streptomyces sp. NEAU-sy36]|uniref:DUF6907 domain-containing protein n=1 Tax=unclassified Streptomyces TaxID=2593676 RepID=UPI0015D60CCC|nr:MULTISPECIES: hypothetical protein [unclassified Streptomyces]QLJ05712.1 hypothetical protein HZZ00_34960 [Streptomyces sp. NEAU-sy36]